MSIDVQLLRKTLGGTPILHDISLHIRKGELVALLGPSGSGKTTLLRLIAGLEDPDSGRILVNGTDATHMPVQARNVGFVFQHFALFRHMTVFDNIAFGLQVRPRKERPGKEAIRKKVKELLALVQLEGLADRYPQQLSGGQRQRVALARALAIDPQILLLDEPFGALDAKVRQELRRWLRELHHSLEITSLFVTHDQEEALEVADRVVIMNAGRIEQIGTPHEVYHYPANPFVFHFLGRTNQFHGVPVPSETGGKGEVLNFVRPHEWEITRPHREPQGLTAVILQMSTTGPLIRLELERTDTHERFEVEISHERFLELHLHLHETVCARPRIVRVFAGDRILTLPAEPPADTSPLVAEHHSR